MPDPSSLVGELSKSPNISALVQRVKRASEAAFRERRAALHGLALDAGDPLLAENEAATRFGNVVEILDRGPALAEEWTLLAALWGLGTRSEPSDGDVEEAIWLDTQTSLSVLSFADVTWPPDSRRKLWEAVERASLDSGRSPAERRSLAAALSLSRSEEGALAAERVWSTTTDPTVKALLADLSAARKPLEGELLHRRSRLRTTLMAVTGLLLVAGLLRFVARFVLGVRRRATFVLRSDGIALTQSTCLLGKPVRTLERFIPLDEIVEVQRETRHAGMALYAGLFALALGSYFGMGLLGDAWRAPGGSPSLLGLGLLAIAIGVLLDFALYRLSGIRGRRARIVIEPRRGRALILSGPLVNEADAWLREVTQSRGWV